MKKIEYKGHELSKSEKAIVDYLTASQGPDHAGTIAQQTGYALSTVRRVVATLCTMGLVSTATMHDGRKDIFIYKDYWNN